MRHLLAESRHSITIGREAGAVRGSLVELAADRGVEPTSVGLSRAPMERGTEVTLAMPGGIRSALRALRGDSPAQQARRLLRDLKAELECGQSLRVEPQPQARGRLGRAVQRVVSDRLASGGRR